MKCQSAILIAIGFSFSLQMPSIAEARFHPTKNQDPTQLLLSKQTNLVVFPEVGLAIPQPNGFTKATSFYGFEQSATNSSVLLSKLPAPFAEATKGFNQKTLATRGINLISKQAVKIENQPGFLLKVSQSAYGQKFLKWILVFGNEQNTNIVTATFPTEQAAKLSETLKKVVLATSSSSTLPSKVSSLPFTITAAAGLSPVEKITSVGKAAAFTKDGNIPTADPADPLFIVAPSLGAVPIGDSKSYATKRLSIYSQWEIGKITSTNEISIDNLPGWEIVADARDRQTQIPLKLYQIMLFPQQGGYILMTGIVGDKQSELYLPKFKAMAITYQNSPK